MPSEDLSGGLVDAQLDAVMRLATVPSFTRPGRFAWRSRCSRSSRSLVHRHADAHEERNTSGAIGAGRHRVADLSHADPVRSAR
jgi:hypothetical protein